MFVLPPNVASIIEILWEIGAVKINLSDGFVGKYHDDHPDAPRFPLYLNLRTRENPKPGPLTDEVIELMAGAFIARLQEGSFRPTHICGIPNAGTPIGKVIARMLNFPHIELLKEDRGGKRHIVGPAERLSVRGPFHPLIVDDVVSEAETKLEAVHVLQQNGAHTAGVMVFADRQQGGSEAMKPLVRYMSAIVTITQTMLHLESKGCITRAERDAALAYPTILRDYQSRLPR